MITKRIHLAVLGPVVLFLPCIVLAQDPNANPGTSPYSQPASGMNQGATQSGQPNSMRDSLGAPGLTGQEMIDKRFVRNAAEASIADLQLGKLALVKGSPAVQGLAQKLIDDHAEMSKDMNAVADSLGIMLPKKMNKDHQREYDKLNGLTGKDFDTEYLTYIATVHYQDLHVYHMEASVAANQDLVAEVVKSLGMMHRHLGMIQSAAKEEGIALPPRPQRPAHKTTSS